MQYFKKTDLANTYHVSVRAVTNWIEATKQGRLDLALFEEKGKLYVANTARNIATIEKIVEERRKYRTTKAHKVITPKPEFYETFSPDQVVDIISNLEVNREIPRQYNYFDKGAAKWDQYSQRLYTEEGSNLLKSTIDLLEISSGYINHLLQGYDKVDIIDIGPGNALPVKRFLANLLETARLGRYVAIDISQDVLEIARKNIERWFAGSIRFEGELRDITFERFADVLTRGSFKHSSEETINVALLLGGTLSNFRDQGEALNALKHSLNRNDLLLYTTKLDSPAARRYFDFNSQPGSTKLPSNHLLMFDLFNLDESLYEVETGFDEQKRARFIRVRLNVALSMKFVYGDGERFVDFNKNDSILVWRAWGQDSKALLDRFEEAGFELLQASITREGDYMLSIHRVKLADQD